MAGDQDLPVLRTGHCPPPAGRGAGAVDVVLAAGAAVDVGARVGGMSQDLVHRRVGGRGPGQLPVPDGRELQAVLAQPQPDLAGRPGRGETLEHGADRAPDRLVGMQQDLPRLLAPHQPGRQRDAQLAAGSLVPQPAEHPGAQHLELSLAHGPLEAQQQPVIEHAGMVDAGLVGDQGIGDPAQVQQPVPLGRRPGQPGDLQRQHDTDLAERDLLGQLGEPGPGRQPGPADAQVGVDDADRRARPAQPGGPADQVVLAQGGFPVALDLDEGGLAAVDQRRAAQMTCRYLLVTHRRSTPRSAAPAGAGPGVAGPAGDPGCAAWMIRRAKIAAAAAATGGDSWLASCDGGAGTWSGSRLSCAGCTVVLLAW